jgi:DNA end-binding protein Ku
MARAIWSGSISFGLVNVPIRLYSATQQKDVRFNQLRAGSSERIRYKRVGEESGDEVPYEDIVKGYEISDGRYVTVTPDELEAVEPGPTRTVEIEDFVLLDEIDPVYFEKTYYIGPADNAGAVKPYELLRRVLDETGKVGIARFVMRSKQYLAVVRPADGVLLLETLFFADEVRSPTVVENRPEGVELNERELQIAEQLIDSLTTEWKPEQYADTYRERVLELIAKKAEGETVSVDRSAPAPNVVDLMAALEASVEAAKEGRRGPDLEARGVDELRDLARERGIRGRSKMSKDQLVDALREAS